MEIDRDKMAFELLKAAVSSGEADANATYYEMYVDNAFDLADVFIVRMRNHSHRRDNAAKE